MNKRASVRWKLLLFLPLMLAACGRTEQPALQGYGEASYTAIAAQEAGVIAALSVTEGQAVTAGQALFRLDPSRLALQERAAGAEEGAARADAALSATAALRAAEAEQTLARATLARSEELFAQGFLPRARLDADRAAAAAAAARAAQARGQARAAQNLANAAGAGANLAALRASDAMVRAPRAGRIERIYRREGEVIAAGEPVLALLAQGDMRIRFFVPQALLSRFPPGARVILSCDGCPSGLAARVTYLAAEPQFTPPVIYSREQRDRLVFLAEAAPNAPASLRPGQPIEVRLP